MSKTSENRVTEVEAEVPKNVREAWIEDVASQLLVGGNQQDVVSHLLKVRKVDIEKHVPGDPATREKKIRDWLVTLQGDKYLGESDTKILLKKKSEQYNQLLDAEDFDSRLDQAALDCFHTISTCFMNVPPRKDGVTENQDWREKQRKFEENKLKGQGASSSEAEERAKEWDLDREKAEGSRWSESLSLIDDLKSSPTKAKAVRAIAVSIYHTKRPRRDAFVIARLVNEGKLAKQAEEMLKCEIDFVWDHGKLKRAPRREPRRRGTPPQSPVESLSRLRLGSGEVGSGEVGSAEAPHKDQPSRMIVRKPGEEKQLRIFGEMLLSHFAATAYLKNDSPELGESAAESSSGGSKAKGKATQRSKRGDQGEGTKSALAAIMEESEHSGSEEDMPDIEPPAQTSEAGQQLLRFKEALSRFVKVAQPSSKISSEEASRSATVTEKSRRGSAASEYLKKVQTADTRRR